MATFYPEGRYKADVVEQGFSEAQTGTVQFVLNIRITETENGDPVQPNNRYVFRAITEKTMPYLLEDLRALGYSGNSLSELDGGDQFIGKQYTFFCKYEADRSGQMQERWSLYRGSSLEMKPPDSKKLRDLDTLFGRAAKAKPGPKQPPPPPPTWGSDPTDDQAPPL